MSNQGKPWDPQPCRNGCGQTIYLKKVNNKWVPHIVVDGVKQDTKHECPNSDFNKKKTISAGFNNSVQQSIDTSQLENKISAVLLEILDTKRIIKDFFDTYVQDNGFNKASELNNDE